MIDFHDVAVKEVLKEMEQHYLDQNVNAFKKSRVIEVEMFLIQKKKQFYSFNLKTLIIKDKCSSDV